MHVSFPHHHSSITLTNMSTPQGNMPTSRTHEYIGVGMYIMRIIRLYFMLRVIPACSGGLLLATLRQNANSGFRIGPESRTL
jgi:hypothetical protein